jgi:AcrR family transcriptional regulator
MAVHSKVNPRHRRSSADVQRELLASASYLFARRGWSGTSVHHIAGRAGVDPQSIYTHFGSKAGIFCAAVVEPFQQFVTSLRRTLTEQHAVRDEMLVRAFVHDLYGSLEQHREAVAAVILAMHEPAAGEARSALESVFNDLPAHDSLQAARGGKPRQPVPPLTQRLTIGLVVASSVFAPWLFSGEPLAASADEIQEALIDFILLGASSDVRRPPQCADKKTVRGSARRRRSSP